MCIRDLCIIITTNWEVHLHIWMVAHVGLMRLQQNAQLTSSRFSRKLQITFIQTQERWLTGTSALSAGTFPSLSSTCLVTFFPGTKGSGKRPIFSLEASPAYVLISQGMTLFRFINRDVFSNHLKGTRTISTSTTTDA